MIFFKSKRIQALEREYAQISQTINQIGSVLGTLKTQTDELVALLKGEGSQPEIDKLTGRLQSSSSRLAAAIAAVNAGRSTPQPNVEKQ